MDDQAYQPHILEPLEIAGVEEFAANQVTLRMRIKTVPLKQWDVGRELRRRILRSFAEDRIDIAIPQQAVWIRQSEDGPRLEPEPGESRS
jgi:small conductance mechanosensitive channel